LAGEETETAANADVADKRMEQTESFMELQLAIRKLRTEYGPHWTYASLLRKLAAFQEL